MLLWNQISLYDKLHVGELQMKSWRGVGEVWGEEGEQQLKPDLFCSVVKKEMLSYGNPVFCSGRLRE